MPSTSPVDCSAQASSAKHRVCLSQADCSAPATSAAMAKLNGTAKEL